MNWLTNFVLPKIRAVVTKKDVPDNLWTKCPSCDQMLFHRELEANLFVCRNCGHHLRLDAKRRLELLFAAGHSTRVGLPRRPTDPIPLRDPQPFPYRLPDNPTANS